MHTFLKYKKVSKKVKIKKKSKISPNVYLRVVLSHDVIIK